MQVTDHVEGRDERERETYIAVGARKAVRRVFEDETFPSCAVGGLGRECEGAHGCVVRASTQSPLLEGSRPKIEPGDILVGSYSYPLYLMHEAGSAFGLPNGRCISHGGCWLPLYQPACTASPATGQRRTQSTEGKFVSKKAIKAQTGEKTNRPKVGSRWWLGR